MKLIKKIFCKILGFTSFECPNCSEHMYSAPNGDFECYDCKNSLYYIYKVRGKIIGINYGTKYHGKFISVNKTRDIITIWHNGCLIHSNNIELKNSSKLLKEIDTYVKKVLKLQTFIYKVNK